MGVSQLLYLLLQFASSVIIARLLNPYEVGVYAVALATVGLIAVFQAFGLYGFVVREKVLTPEVRASAFTINAALSLLLAGLIAAMSIFGGALLHEPGVRKVMLLLAFSPVIGLLQFLPEAQLEREAQFQTISVINTLKTLISQGLAVYLAFHGYSYMSLAYGQLVAAVFGMVTYNIVGRRHVSVRLGISEWRRVGQFGVQMLAISGVTSLADRATDFILARLLGLSALGLFSRASNLNNLLWENIHLITGKVLFVDLATKKREGVDLRDTYVRINDLNTVLLWPAFSGLAIVSGPFIVAVYGEKWAAASHPLCLLAISSMIYVSLSMTWDLFVLDGRTSDQTKIEYVRMIVAVSSFTVGCLFSITAAASSRVLTALFSNALYRPHVSQITRTFAADFTSIYIRNGFITAGAIAPSALVMAANHASERTPLPIVAGSIPLGVTIWLVLLFLTKHPLSYELKTLRRRLQFGLIKPY